MRTIVLTLFGMLLTACASTTRPTVSAPAGHESGEEAAVLAAMDRYVHAISENDLKAMAAMQTRDGMTSHCGVDVFDFVKLDGEWRLSNSMWTVEPGACEALRPRDGNSIRPTGPAPTRNSAPDDARPATIPPHQQVFAAERAFATSMVDRDLDAFAGFVADEAIFFGGTAPLRGEALVVSG
jgi:hypothetical protein